MSSLSFLYLVIESSISLHLNWQVTSELEHPILAELSVAIAGKKGIICESVLSEFQELVSMCAGPSERLRADQLIKHLQ